MHVQFFLMFYSKIVFYITNETLVSSFRGKNVVISLREWINMAYLRIFLLALDGYLIVSRFYSACRNFCALWLGKRRRLYHHSSQSPTSPTERTKLNNPSNGVLLWRSSEVEQLSLSNNGDALSSQATNVNDVSNKIVCYDFFRDLLFHSFTLFNYLSRMASRGYFSSC